MPSVQIKGVPDDVHRVLRTRAASVGQSLQEYLLARLVEVARDEPLEEVLGRAGGRSTRFAMEDRLTLVRQPGGLTDDGRANQRRGAGV